MKLPFSAPVAMTKANQIKSSRGADWVGYRKVWLESADVKITGQEGRAMRGTVSGLIGCCPWGERS